MNIKDIAKLARIKLTDEEEKLYSNQFEEILKWVKQLDELDTENTEPVFNITGNQNSYFEDEIREFEDRQLILKNFSNREFDFLKVKKVIDQ